MFPLGHTHFSILCPPPLPSQLKGWILPSDHTQLAGNVPVSQVAGWELVRQSCWEWGTNTFFPAISQNAWHGFRKLYSCFVVVFRSFSQHFLLGAHTFRIPQGKILTDSGFYKPRFSGFRNANSLTWGVTWENIENTVGQKVKEYRAANEAVVLVRSFELGTWLIYGKKFSKNSSKCSEIP